MEPTNPGHIPLEAYRLAAHSSPIGLSFADVHERYVWANPAFLRMIGTDLAHLRGLPVSDLYPTVGPGETMGARLIKEETESLQIDHRIIAMDGREIWLNVSVGLIRDPHGRPLYSIGQELDITERQRRDQRMYWLAYHDGLTGLSTRHVLDDRLNQALLRAQRDNYGQVSVLYIDLDNFKTINDTHGHHTGDQVLIHVAQRLRASVRESDTVCRLGGDEFVVLLDPITRADHAHIVADRIHTALRHPLRGSSTAPMPARIAASIGIATTHGAAVTANELLHNADNAMYHAKNRGGNTSHTTTDAGIPNPTTIIDLSTNSNPLH